MIKGDDALAALEEKEKMKQEIEEKKQLIRRREQLIRQDRH